MGVLTDEVLAAVGRKGPPRTEVVNRRDLRKYAIATGQTQRRYIDGDEAPPLYHVALFWDVVPLSELSPDGVSIDRLLPRFPLEKAMAGGLDIQYFQKIRPGDVLTGTRTLTSIYEKAGRSGALIFYEVVLDVVRDDGTLVLTEKTTRLLR
ncbi:MAG: MaoC family dehydratase N-terminal domain-containing protein [Pseudomonadales bacterium]|nr:MaoC family dehydratase N-terminal domain-containing protein [Pseudomonadales bacterium]MCP5185009.1 MaoC family dehydratase N-terminal domain-containing protein [Pseudomonadales bacterium]